MEDYAVWRACERFNIRPPDVADSWEACNVVAKARLIAYDQIRELEETESMNRIFR